ncbi:MATE family efflux transporter [Clostridium sp. MCC345]|uniref:MATE family efflux transporter n=1 Tax=Clostridium sp. MCC345 TaxID=2592645 RepID=UPI001C0196FF|nr:MATE family efflux transporter [Clostridium sp. MCC345]
MERNLTTGNVGKNILIFSLPYLLSYFLQTLYGMADLFIIGQFDGVASTTAVSIGSQVMHMLTVMLIGLAMGTTVSIARAVGGRNHKQVSENVGNTVTLFFGLSIVLTVVLLLLVRPIVGVMSTPAEAVDGTVAYLTICFLGIPFITAYNIISSIFRGMGDSKSPMYFIAIACAANIMLDYLFIGALGFGPAGAALGTTLAQTISVAVSLFMILRRKSISLSKGDFHPRRSVVGQILQIGVPVALQDGLIQIAFIVITIIANRRGLNDAAAVGIVEKIIGFVFLVPSSMLSTVSALGAQNIGAGKPERAVQTLRYAICITVGFGLCVCIGVQLCAEQLVALFTDRQAAGGAEVIRFGGQYLRSYILDCVFAGIHFSFSGYFCACGKSVLSFLHNISSVLLVRVPGSYLASMLFPDTLFPMGLASAGGSLLSVMLCILFYLKFCRGKNPAAESA